MPKKINMTGMKINKLEVIGEAGKDKRGETIWLCKCDCGKYTTVTGSKLRTGWTKSCGCLQTEHRKEGFNRRHGMTNAKLYTAWSNMKSRCYYAGNIMYKNYGGRGVTVCDSWKNSFESFAEWAVSNGYADDLTLERIDVNGNYEPGNCKWITNYEQKLNKRNTHRLEAFGKNQTIAEWSKETGIKYNTIERRINKYGWSAEDAVTIKPHVNRRKRG